MKRPTAAEKISKLTVALICAAEGRASDEARAGWYGSAANTLKYAREAIAFGNPNASWWLEELDKKIAAYERQQAERDAMWASIFAYQREPLAAWEGEGGRAAA